MIGERVSVLARSGEQIDEMGILVTEWTTRAVVDDVLVAPSSTTDLDGSTRPEGTRTTWVLHFPRTLTGSLRGCRVQVRGRLMEVVGDPQPYSEALTPTRWDRPVYVQEVGG